LHSQQFFPDAMRGHLKRPYLFLFDSGTKGVKEPALSTFTGALLDALSTADPDGETIADLRGGLPILSDLVAQISEVFVAPNRSGHTQTHDMPLFRLLLWDMAEALSEAPNSPSSLAILDVLRRGAEECLALSDLPDDIRERCDAILKQCPGYVGSCRLDAGNPVLRSAFFDKLAHFATISDGAVTQQRTMEGDEDWELNGACRFKPHGLKWIDYTYTGVPQPFRLEEAPVSTRGALSLDRLKRKTTTTVEGRIFRALREASWTDRTGQSFRFAAAEPGHDILQAVLPEGKFTRYLFDRDHGKGGAKAGFVMDELGFEPDDWRYLAAQFYDGLLLAEPRDLVVQLWQDGYGARFNVFVEVTSRTGKRGVMRTGWMLKPQMLPSLVTAVPRHDAEAVAPPTPPVLTPQTKGDAWWEALFRLADEQGRAAHMTTLPTPMLLEDYGVIEEGECGSAIVLISDARRGFARWLIKAGLGSQYPKGGAAVFCNLPSQSLERAKAYAMAFARVLALNGVPSRVETYFT
jgi:hypothetical protein